MRLINAANARIMSIVLKGSDVWLAALDGHPVTPLRLAGHPLDLAPGQRADLILPQVAGPGGDRQPDGRRAAGDCLDHPHRPYGWRRRRRAAAGLGRLAPAASDGGEVFKATLRIEGGAGGGLQGARYGGRRLTMRKLVAEGRSGRSMARWG